MKSSSMWSAVTEEGLSVWAVALAEESFRVPLRAAAVRDRRRASSELECAGLRCSLFVLMMLAVSCRWKGDVAKSICEDC